MKHGKVAYIVVGWNNEDLLKECMDSIRNQSYPDKLIIYVDNASKDDSIELIRSNFPEIIVLNQNKNFGFAKGNNIGINYLLSDSDVKYVALVNTDARLDKEWTKQIIDFAQLKPKGALFQGTTLDYYDHNIIDSTHIFVSLNGQGTQGNWRYYVTSDQGPKKIFGVNAAACIITRSFIETQPFKGQLFDEALFMYLEDVDLSMRATIMGWDNYLVPSARAYHMGSKSSSTNPGFSLYMTFRNNNAVLFKNLPLVLLCKMIPKIIRGDIDTIKTLWRMGKKYAVIKVLKGRAIGALRLPLFFRKKILVKKSTNLSVKYLAKLMEKGF